MQQRHAIAKHLGKIQKSITAASDNNYFDKKTKYFDKDILENSKYIVGVQGLKIPKLEFSRFEFFFIEKGFNINLVANHNSPPSYLAKKALVLYYSSMNKDKAKEIANDLTKLTGTKFDIAIGMGLAVFDKEKQFYIHWVR